VSNLTPTPNGVSVKNLKRLGTGVALAIAATLVASCTAEAGAADYVAYEPAVIEEPVIEEPVDEAEDAEEYESNEIAEPEPIDFDYNAWEQINGFYIRQVDPVDWDQITTIYVGGGNNSRVSAFRSLSGTDDADVIWIQANLTPRPGGFFINYAAQEYVSIETGALIHPLPADEFGWSVLIVGGTEGSGDVLWEIRGEGIRNISDMFLQGNLELPFVSLPIFDLN
jgi:hypothetical protein